MYCERHVDGISMTEQLLKYIQGRGGMRAIALSRRTHGVSALRTTDHQAVGHREDRQQQETLL